YPKCDSVGPRLIAFSGTGGVAAQPARTPRPCAVSDFVNEPAPVPLAPPNGPVWVVPLMLNVPYVAPSENGLEVPPLTFPLAIVTSGVPLPSFSVVLHFTVIEPVALDGPSNDTQSLVLPLNTPDTDALMTCTSGSLALGFVTVQPASEPLTLITSADVP